MELETCTCNMDCFDLQDWVIENMPELYEATRYISFSVAIESRHRVYHMKTDA